MARILETCFNTEDFLEHPHVIMLVEESVFAVHSAFTYAQDPQLTVSPGKHYLRWGNEFERGLILGRLIELLPEAIIYSSRPEVIRRYFPKTQIEPVKGPQYTPPPPSPPRPPRVSAEPEKPHKPIVDTALETVYWDVVNKYAETYLIGTSLPDLKRMSVLNQLKNFSNGTLTSKRMPAVDITNPEELAQLIYNDFKANVIFEERGNVLYFNEDNIRDIFETRNRKLKTFFENASQKKNILGGTDKNQNYK